MQNTTIKYTLESEDTYGFAHRAYGSLAGIFDVLALNGLGFDDELEPDLPLIVGKDITLVSDFDYNEKLVSSSRSDYYTYIVKENQNIVDLVLQHGGDLEGLFAYYLTMGKTSLNNDVEPGEELVFRRSSISTNAVVKYFETIKRNVATGKVNISVKVIGTHDFKAIKTNDGKLLLVI